MRPVFHILRGWRPVAEPGCSATLRRHRACVFCPRNPRSQPFGIKPNYMSYLLIFCTVSLLIILHELGHFLAAKRMGIPIARFSIGLGPKVWGFKMGETEYWLSLIPCGGYVMPAMKDAEAFDKIPLTRRILFSFSGPAANILGAFLCLSLMNSVKLGCSVDSVIYLPLEQIWRMALQIGTAIPLLFSQPEHLSGIVGIIAGAPALPV